VGAVETDGASFSRVRITSGLNTIVSNGQLGNPNDNIVVMDHSLYAEPGRTVAEPSSLALLGLGPLGALGWFPRRQRA
jgi:hypothetical protein